MSGLLLDKDTTFALMLAATARGHEIRHALPLALHAVGDSLHVDTTEVAVWRTPTSPTSPTSTAQTVEGDGYRLGRSLTEDVATFDAVLVRNDPPFDANYAWMTQLLELVRDKTFVMNDPRGLRDANEKLYAMHFPAWTPKTLVTSSRAKIRAFVEEVGGTAVIKPLDGMAGLGIFVLRSDDRNANAIIEATIGEHGRRWCMVQEYLPAARQGDKRILLLDGEPLGAILRVPREDEARANIHMGGSVQRAEITPLERAMIADLAPRLRRDGLYFVGLDVIGERLTEVNVTSPTGIQQMARLDGVDYAARVITWLEQRTRRR